MSELGLASDQDCNSERNPKRQPFGEVILQNFAVSSVGFWVFIGCGRQKTLYRMWGVIFGHLARGEFGEMWKYVKYGEKRRKRTLSSEKTHSKGSSQTEKDKLDKEIQREEAKIEVDNELDIINNTTQDASSFVSDLNISSAELAETPRSDVDILKSDVENGVQFDNAEE